MSPVPLKKQSMAGTSILKKRGVCMEVDVEPIMERRGEVGVKETEVMIMCGIW